MLPTPAIVWLFILIAVELSGMFLFSRGFFPHKSHVDGFASPEDIPIPPGQATIDACQMLTQVSSVEKGQTEINKLLDTCLGIEPQFDRLIFMVVDSLRHDFIFDASSGMTFTQSLIAKQHALPYIALATAPTVTLPRVKALTTGSVPNFLDVVLNLDDSQRAGQDTMEDNWLLQFLQRRGKRIIFFGDETWLRLYTYLIKRADGTSSLFAWDTVEVDQNVTRHVEPELNNEDWDVMILHYLGVDHVGHTYGPKSPLMRPKQEEMDGIVKLIYEYTEKIDQERKKNDTTAKSTLIVLCGDHGMNEMGNHGGNSYSETSPGMVLITPSVTWQDTSIKTVNQIDIVPTLSLLFGVPTPRNSLGKLIPELFATLPPIERLRAYQLNAHQVRNILIARWGKWDTGDRAWLDVSCEDSDIAENEDVQLVCFYEKALALHQRALAGDDASIPQAIAMYDEFTTRVTSKLALDFSALHFDLISIGTLIMFCGLSVISFLVLRTLWRLHSDKPSASMQPLLRMHIYSIAIMTCILFSYYCCALSGTSSIDEEHQTWYFMIQTIWFIQVLVWTSATQDDVKARRFAIDSFFQMVLFRLIRSWNQTGKKYSYLIDLRFYLTSSHVGVSRLLLCVTLAGILVWTIVRFRTSLIYRNGPSRLYSLAVLVITLITSIPIFIYKILTERAGNDETDTIKRVLSVLNTTDLARSAYAGIAILYVLAWLPIRKYHIYIRQNQRLWTCLLATTLLLLLLSRMHNAFLYMLAFAQLYLLERQVRLLKSLLTPTSTWAMVPTRYATVIPLTCLAVPIICLQQSAFFSFGNANSISSIDLSNAYTGLTSYIPVLVGLLTFIANWAGPIWWHVAAIYVLCSVCETTQPPMRGSRQEVQSMKDSTAYEQWTGSIHLYLWGNALFYGASLISLTLAMITHRHHLFIWEVFSPKYLYQMAWMVFHLLSVSWTVIWHIWST